MILFLGKGELTSDANKKGAPFHKWVKVISVSGSGTTEDTTTGDGPTHLMMCYPLVALYKK